MGEGDGDADWPVDLSGVTESVVTTLGPNDRWNVAALGVFAPEDENGDDPATATTWGRTRTWRNFDERGAGYVQFTRDPVDFVDAACSVREEDEPVLDSADAWTHVEVREVDSGERGGTQWVKWELRPVESAVERRVVPTTNRGYYAVIEATVAVSRLDVPEYDTDELLARIDYFESVVDRCGGEREQQAFERLREYADL
ncbi:DUF447 domain-containing protein [Natronomonas sp.]|uniref:DUF447 domain-containing protein n=1 Tax=Natronomonas sp. TaxID=2184060 RepID=UPI002FC2E0FE